MLVDVEHSGSSRKLFTGIYQSDWWNFELDFRGRQDGKKDWPVFFSEFSCYGVCDSPEQLIEHMPEDIKTSEVRYVISLVKLEKKDQPDWGGWRWHRWGEYIGTQKPQCEYLHDEPEIETVWTYHIYEV